MNTPVKLSITPADPNYMPNGKPEVREFASRAIAQSKIDELYGNGYIDRAEWSRLFDSLSPADPDLLGVGEPSGELVESGA